MVERVAFALGEPMERKEDYEIPEEIAEWIGLKKSELLSSLIQKMSSDDFGFEEFHDFNHLVPSTIENPDKAYESEEDDQTMRTYVKSYDEKGRFHQVVQGILLDDPKTNADVFIPILIFISRKDDLVREFSVGEVIARPVLN